MAVEITEYMGFPVKVANRWELIASRLFGKSLIGTDGRTTVIGYTWKGRLYVHDVLTLPMTVVPPAPRSPR